MTPSDEARRHVLESVDADDLRAAQAAKVLGLSERHVRRPLAAYRAQGAAALFHGNRGRRPQNAVLARVAGVPVRFATERCMGALPTHN